MVIDPLREPQATQEVEQVEAAQGMAELWDSEGSDLKNPRRGDIIEGEIMGLDRDTILVDVGGKTEGIIPPHERRSLTPEQFSELQVGDELLVYVLQTENQEGQMILSLDRATGERGWRSLQQRSDAGETFDAEVVGYNKGGLLVNIEGIRGFVPASQASGLRMEDSDSEASEERFAEWIGKSLRLKIIEINRRRNRLILSERAAMQEWRTQQKERLLEELQEGTICQGRVTSIRPFGVFIDLGGADGLVPLSELSWGRIKGPEEVARVGEQVDVYVLKVDHENKKIALSLRRARPEEWDSVVDNYQVGQLTRGTITKLTNFGAFAHIEGPVEGLIHISELADRRIQHPKEVVKEGDVLTLKIVRIERDRHRLGLSLKQALEEMEAQEQSSVRQQIQTMQTETDATAPALGDMVTPSAFSALEQFRRETDVAEATHEAKAEQPTLGDMATPSAFSALEQLRREIDLAESAVDAPSSATEKQEAAES